jgi:hypothetical protein
VTFPRPDKIDASGEAPLVSHRVIAVSDQLGEPTLWTKGDANEAIDSWAVPADAVIGEVRFTVPYLGRIRATCRHLEATCPCSLSPRCWLSSLSP